jgi:hypothetical protein
MNILAYSVIPTFSLKVEVMIIFYLVLGYQVNFGCRILDIIIQLFETGEKRAIQNAVALPLN